MCKKKAKIKKIKSCAKWTQLFIIDTLQPNRNDYGLEILATYETFQLHLSAYHWGTTPDMQDSTLRYRSARTWLFCLYFTIFLCFDKTPYISRQTKTVMAGVLG